MRHLVRVLLLYNPVSGTGRGEALARQLEARLQAVSLEDGSAPEVSTAPTQLEATATWLDPMLAGIDVLVVIGGDGAVRMAADAAIRTGVALYQYPAGTENLFARDFGMLPRAEALEAAITHGTHTQVDVARVNGECMLLCASVGIDAAVANEVAASRGKSISHATYIWPLLRQLFAWRRAPWRFEIEVDGTPLGDGSPGFVLVANSRQYALRLDPARKASNDDGLLDVVLMPAASIMRLIAWAVRCRLGGQYAHPGFVHARGREIVIRPSRPAWLQVDGDASGGGDQVEVLKATIEPGALTVLRPPSEKAGT